MSINFPILNTQQQLRKPLWKIKRHLACVNRLGYFQDRSKLSTARKFNTQAHTELPEQEQQPKNQQYSEREAISLSIPSLTLKIQIDSPCRTRSNFNKKSTQGLNRNFNKTKTDWDHNFIGQKYLRKIKQQLSKTKSQKFTNSASKARTKINWKLLEQHLNPQNQNHNYNHNHNQVNAWHNNNSNNTKYERGLDQLRRIKAMKDKRRERISKRSPQIYCTNNKNNSNINTKIKVDMDVKTKDENIHWPQFQALSPWEQSSNFSMSSLWAKRA